MTGLQYILQVQVFYRLLSAVSHPRTHTHSHGLSPFPKSTFPIMTDPRITQLLPDIPEHCSNLSLFFLGLFEVFLALVRLGIGTAVEVEDEFLGQLGD